MVGRALIRITEPWWRDAVRHDRERTAGWRRVIGLPWVPPATSTLVPFPVAGAVAAADPDIALRLLRVIHLLDQPATVFDSPAMAARVEALDLPPTAPVATRAEVVRAVHALPEPRTATRLRDPRSVPTSA